MREQGNKEGNKENGSRSALQPQQKMGRMSKRRKPWPAETRLRGGQPSGIAGRPNHGRCMTFFVCLSSTVFLGTPVFLLDLGARILQLADGEKRETIALLQLPTLHFCCSLRGHIPTFADAREQEQGAVCAACCVSVGWLHDPTAMTGWSGGPHSLTRHPELLTARIVQDAAAAAFAAGP